MKPAIVTSTTSTWNSAAGKISCRETSRPPRDARPADMEAPAAETERGVTTAGGARTGTGTAAEAGTGRTTGGGLAEVRISLRPAKVGRRATQNSTQKKIA